MKVYVASHCRWAGLHVAAVLEADGHEITSTWLRSEFLPTDYLTPNALIDIATIDAEDVAQSDALVLVAGRDRYPGGKFVEVGIALALGKRIIVIGHRENALMWHPKIDRVDTPDAASEKLTNGR